MKKYLESVSMMGDNLVDKRIAPLMALVDTDFQQAAGDLIVVARGLLSLSDAALLARTPDGRLTLWTSDSRICLDRARVLTGDPVLRPAVVAFDLAARQLLGRLATAPAMGAAVTLVTDGTGLTLTHDRPTSDPAWLFDLAGCDGHALPVLPMATDGIWPMLAAMDRPTVH
ncbi:hypothetical protein QE361_000140 [Sphingomonas sp. SORGH_AS802]|uniref:hypothetical protein n=1 Tax=unclassified Sphingomonas TaxID=196159 RepID=UPI00285E6272|nr:MULTISPECIES: hypothetical protein [unclassified Sphingomonas]MDR6127908.1 hypothetical protein [Sphingomonas sp. SORGH_AS_0438]MDR6133182.1 hypothetical protein [Sphingomonas sp. SORGH_AS_0802]